MSFAGEDEVNYIPEELTIGVVVRQDGMGQVLNAVIDTGCGAGYLVGGETLGLRLDTASYTASFVDGTKRRITHSVRVSLVVGGIEREVVLRVIEGNGPYLLFGRELIQLFDIIVHGDKVSQGCKVLNDEVKLLEEFLETDDFEELQELPEGEDDRVTLPLPDNEREKVRELLIPLLESPKELPFCPGATIRLRKVEGALDTEEQEFSFELKLPEPKLDDSLVQKNRCYSRSLYEKLVVEEIQQFDELIKEYVDKGYWVRASKDECQRRCLYTANVFPVKADGKKMRLVSDFRVLNTFLKSTTAVSRSHHPVLLLRSFFASELYIGDVKAAFYKVKLSEPVLLTVGRDHYFCERMAFGLAPGVEALRCSLGMLFDLWKSCFANCFANQYGHAGLWVDDFFITHGQTVPSWIYMAGLCGFSVSRKKFQEDPEEGKLLGAIIARNKDDGSTVLRCDSKGTELIQELSTNLTKKSVFSFCGIISYDIGHVHPELRIIADMMRSIIGKQQCINWTTIINLSGTDLSIWKTLISWATKLLSTPCQPHLTYPYRFPSNVLSRTGSSSNYFRLETDASKYGYAIVILHRSHEEQGWRR